MGRKIDKTKLRRKILLLINKRDPPFQSKEQFLFENYRTKGHVAACAQIVIKEHIEDGYVVDFPSLKLTDKGREHLQRLQAFHSSDILSNVALGLSIFALVISVIVLFL